MEVVVSSMAFPVAVQWDAEAGDYGTITPVWGEVPDVCRELLAVRFSRNCWVVIRSSEDDPRWLGPLQWMILIDQSAVHLQREEVAIARTMLEGAWSDALEYQDWDEFNERVAALYLTHGNPSGGIIS